MLKENVSKEFVYATVVAVGDDIYNNVVSYDTVDRDIVIVEDIQVEFFASGVDCAEVGDRDVDGYSYYGYNYTAVQGDVELFTVDVFVYNNGDIMIQNCEYDEFQYTIKEVV